MHQIFKKNGVYKRNTSMKSSLKASLLRFSAVNCVFIRGPRDKRKNHKALIVLSVCQKEHIILLETRADPSLPGDMGQSKGRRARSIGKGGVRVRPALCLGPPPSLGAPNSSYKSTSLTTLQQQG